MTMLIVSAVFENSGTSKNSGNPFKMPRANVLMPWRGRDTPNFKQIGTGLNQIEVAVDEKGFFDLSQAFAARSKGLPVPLECNTSYDDEGKLMILSVAEKAN